MIVEQDQIDLRVSRKASCRRLEVTAGLLLLLLVVTSLGGALYFHHLNDSLIAALERQEHGRIRSLLARGARVDPRSRQGRSLILWAAGSGDPALLGRLLDRGCDVNARAVWPDGPRDGWTPLMLAAEHGDASSVELLISLGAEVNARSRRGDRALTVAARTGCFPAVARLVAAGAEVNVLDGWGYTPLLWSVSIGSEATARLLLQHGADVNCHRRPGATSINALTFARATRNRRMVVLLKRAGARD